MDKKILTDTMVSPEQLLTKWLNDNNLTIALTKCQTRYLEDGGLVIEAPRLVVTHVQPKSDTLKN